MKFLLVDRRYLNVDAIDAVLLADPQSATVWYGGNAEPLQARPCEVADIRQYVTEAQYGGGR